MKLRSLIVTVLVLAALSAVVYFVRRPGPPPSADTRVGQTLIDRAAIEKAAKLRLSDQGKSVTLTRQSDGTWRVPSYYDMPADFQKLSSFVSSLTDAKVERLVTSNAERISRLEFKDTKIELLDNSDKELWSLTLGKTPELGGGRYVRYGNEQKAYLANVSAWIDAEPKNWANAELLNVKADDVAKMEITFPDAPAITFSRAKKDDAWTADKTPDKQRVNAAKITSTLGTVGNVRFSETSDLADPNVAAAKKNERTVKLTTFDNKTYTVALGRKPEEKKLKPPAPSTDGKSGPAALGSVADLNKKDDKPKDGAEKSGDAKSDAKPLTPEYETIPAGPVYVFITSSDANAPVNALMQKRAFQVYEYAFTSLPQKPEELFEPAPVPAPIPVKEATTTPAPTPPAPANEPKK
jgi:hypothetical protein